MKYIIEIEILEPHTASEIVEAISDFADNIKEWADSCENEEEKLPTDNSFCWELWNESREGFEPSEGKDYEDVRITCEFKKIK